MNEILRKRTRTVRAGNVCIGGGNPIVVQSMASTKTTDVKGTITQIRRLEEAGCEMIRVAVPDAASAEAIKAVKKGIGIPLVADIQYNGDLAVLSIKNGADKVRINPGNIGGTDKLREIVKAALEYSVPIRIGVNSGSLDEDIIREFGGVNCASAFHSIERHIGLLGSLGFDDLVLSVKSPDIMLNHEVNVMLADRYDHPIHLGITESGSDMEGIIRSSVGIGLLLSEGIGDTIRVSLSNDPVEEVYAAKEILRSLGIRRSGVEVISCPTCARTCGDILGISRKIKECTRDIGANIKVAVMGCAVNGIGEAKEADIGIAGGKNGFVLFRDGKIVSRIDEERAVDELLKQIRGMARDAEKTL